MLATERMNNVVEVESLSAWNLTITLFIMESFLE